MRTRSLLLLLLACLALPSCKDKKKGEGGGEATATLEPSSPIEPAIAKTTDAQTKRSWHGDYVLRSGTLYRILEDGKSESVLTHQGARSCKSDSRSQSIWLVGSAGLSVYDLDSQKLELVVAADPGVIGAFEVRFGFDQGKVGNADGQRDDVALIVVATKHVSLKSEIICEGAREALCYVDTSSDDPDMWELRPVPAQLKAQYDTLTLSETPLLLALAKRRLDRPELDEEDEENEGAELQPKALPSTASDGQEAEVTGESLAPVEHLACGKIHEYVATAPSASTQ